MTIRAALWLSLILLPVPAFAQGTIAGTATDNSGQFLQGVRVELLTAGIGAGPTRMSVTDRSGRYEFRDVPPGTYTVRFTLPGFTTVRRTRVQIAGGARVTVDVVLSPQFDDRRPRPAPPFEIDPDRRCLHGSRETVAETRRREDALAAMRLIDGVLQSFPTGRRESPRWEEVAESAAVKRLRSQGNDLAFRIQWGTNEPLPGWGIAWVTSQTRSRFALIDLRDPCGFSYSSEDPEVLQSYRVVPLTS